jgi:O-antigen/teichoic acid export membrane protein
LPSTESETRVTVVTPADHESLRRRVRLGVWVLVARTVIIQVTVLGGTFYLARLLEPADFGVKAILDFALYFFALFGDAGFAVALMQQRDTPNQRQLSSVWWLQLLVSASLVIAVFPAASLVPRIWPDLPPSAPWLLRCLALQLLITAMRVVPAILLERELKFAQLAALDFVMTLVFYGAAVLLARLHYGVVSLFAAALLQGLVGLVLVFALRPWRPSWVIDRKLLAPIVKFGVTYQAKHVIAFFNGAVTPVYAGVTLGKRPLGLNNWAQQTASFPLQLVEIMRRASFPLWARLQGDRSALAASIERTVQTCCIVTMFFSALFFGIGPNLIHIVFTDKWMPALPLLYVYAFGIGICFLSPLIGAALDALGKPKPMVHNAVFTTLVNWTIILVLMPHFRSLFAFAVLYQVHLFFGNGLALWELKKLVPEVRLLRRMAAPILTAALVAAFGRYVLKGWITGPLTLVATIVAIAAAFVGTMFVLDRRAVRDALAAIPRKRVAP